VNSNIWVLMSADSVALATTLILAALGALFTERAGVLNLGIEGILLTSAVTSFIAADWGSSSGRCSVRCSRPSTHCSR
jgi:simple sugar transport system permease protein